MITKQPHTLEIHCYYRVGRTPATLQYVFITRPGGSVVRRIDVPAGVSEDDAIADARRLCDEIEASEATA